MILTGMLNFIRFGSFGEFGYGSLYGTFSLNTEWQGLLGLLLSPGKGLIFYFPLVILFPLAIKFSFRQNPSLSFLTVYIFVVLWLYFGTLLLNGESRSWSGAIAWGPRYFVPLLPLVALLIGGLLKYPQRFKTKRLIYLSIVLFSVTGFIINLGGVLVWSEYGLIYASERERLGGFAWELMTWDPIYSPVVLHMKMLFSNYISDIPLADYRDTGWDYALYGLAPCQYDLYIHCKFGVVPVILLSCVAVLLAFLILVRNKKEEYVYS
jgi:hypothetical protein